MHPQSGCLMLIASTGLSWTGCFRAHQCVKKKNKEKSFQLPFLFCSLLSLFTLVWQPPHAWRSKRQLDYARLTLCAAPAGIHLLLTGGCACVQEEQQQILVQLHCTHAHCTHASPPVWCEVTDTGRTGSHSRVTARPTRCIILARRRPPSPYMPLLTHASVMAVSFCTLTFQQQQQQKG